MLNDADNDAADDIDRHDDQAGDGVAAHELGGSVHGTEEGAFLLQLFAPQLGDVLCNQAGGKVGVDRHLLAGHGVQGETGGHLGDATGTLGDDHEIDDHQDRKDNQADGEAAPGHQAAEAFDHLAGAVCALVAMPEDQSGRRHIERQSEEGCDQEHRGEGGEFYGFADE